VSNPGKTAQTMINLLAPYKYFVKMITVDNGKEFAIHKYIKRKLNTSIYFTHPCAAYEKRLVENTNKLIRQYFLNPYLSKQSLINKYLK
jgi:IS30 family transposase